MEHGSTETFLQCSSKSRCEMLPTKSRLAVSTPHNITWWDIQIKKEMSNIKLNDMTYEDIVIRRRWERKKFQQSKTHQGSSHHKDSAVRVYPEDRLKKKTFVDALKKYINKPKDVRRKVENINFSNTTDNYNKIGKMIKQCFYKLYTKNFDDEDGNIEEILNILIEMNADSLPAQSAVKVYSALLKYMQNIQQQRIKSLNIVKYELVTRMIHRDLKALKKKKCTIAFGQTIAHRAHKPSRYDFRSKYVNMDHPRPKLESFEAVWQNIFELETTKKFCDWLKLNPHIEPPAYLSNHNNLKERSILNENLSDLLVIEDVDGYSNFNNSMEYYDMMRNTIASVLSSNSSTESSTSTLHSGDISDINIDI